MREEEGVCVCSPRGILHELNGPAGNVGVVVVGGMAEMIVSRPSTNRLILKNRKGFVKLALKAGSSLVPVYTFGEPNTYDQPFNGKWYKWLQKIRSPQSAGFALFSGPCEPGYLFGLLPYQTPLTTVVGKPIKLPKVENPTNGMVDEYHTKFVQELTKLFEKYKIKYDPQGENAILSIE
ncbi:diacylglycerol O-acyltransferase 2-like isoform X2 [Planococcus citri]|uniref:diacylglycerol O-acyltransferase 2-like isoform X2 n=1 Tax=Planococcus citri TaxID=170843 RepID=UPI0031F8212C